MDPSERENLLDPEAMAAYIEARRTQGIEPHEREWYDYEDPGPPCSEACGYCGRCS